MLLRYTIETPPYADGRIEYDEDGDFVKHDDVSEIIDAAMEVCTWDWSRILRDIDTDGERMQQDLERLSAALEKLVSMEPPRLLGA